MLFLDHKGRHDWVMGGSTASSTKIVPVCPATDVRLPNGILKCLPCIMKNGGIMTHPAKTCSKKEKETLIEFADKGING